MDSYVYVKNVDVIDNFIVISIMLISDVRAKLPVDSAHVRNSLHEPATLTVLQTKRSP